MVASSLQLLLLALLLRPSNLTAGKVQLCDLTPHCSLLRRRHDWVLHLGCSALYSGMARGPGSLMSHMSAKGTRRFMKASAPLLRGRSTRHDGPMKCHLYCIVLYCCCFARSNDTNPIKQERAGFFRVVDETGHTFQRQF